MYLFSMWCIPASHPSWLEGKYRCSHGGSVCTHWNPFFSLELFHLQRCWTFGSKDEFPGAMSGRTCSKPKLQNVFFPAQPLLCNSHGTHTHKTLWPGGWKFISLSRGWDSVLAGDPDVWESPCLCIHVYKLWTPIIPYGETSAKKVLIHLQMCGFLRCFPASPLESWNGRIIKVGKDLLRSNPTQPPAAHRDWVFQIPAACCPKLSTSLKHPQGAGKNNPGISNFPPASQKQRNSTAWATCPPPFPSFSKGTLWPVPLQCFVTPVPPKATQPQGRGEAHSW